MTGQKPLFGWVVSESEDWRRSEDGEQFIDFQLLSFFGQLAETLVVILFSGPDSQW